MKAALEKVAPMKVALQKVAPMKVALQLAPPALALKKTKVAVEPLMVPVRPQGCCSSCWHSSRSQVVAD